MVCAPLIASDKKGNQEARYLDDAVYEPCHGDCAPFNIAYFYFCLETRDRILIGQKHAWKWEYNPAQMHPLRGKTVSLRYDDKYIWLIRTDGKEMKLKQDYSMDVFRDQRCKDVIHAPIQKKQATSN